MKFFGVFSKIANMSSPLSNASPGVNRQLSSRGGRMKLPASLNMRRRKHQVDLGMIDQRLGLQRDARRKQTVIVAQHFDELALRFFDATQHVLLQAQDALGCAGNERVRRVGKRLSTMSLNLVAGRIVTDDDFNVLVGLGKRAFQRLTEEARVEGRDDDTDERALISRRKLSSGEPPPFQAEATEPLRKRRLAARQRTDSDLC